MEEISEHRKKNILAKLERAKWKLTPHPGRLVPYATDFEDAMELLERAIGEIRES